MKLLIDGCISNGVARYLTLGGHDATWVGDWSVDPGDPEILARALAEERVVITADRGFGALAVLEGRRHAGIIVMRKIHADAHAAVCKHIIDAHEADLMNGAIVIVTNQRVRVRWPAKQRG